MLISCCARPSREVFRVTISRFQSQPTRATRFQLSLSATIEEFAGLKKGCDHNYIYIYPLIVSSALMCFFPCRALVFNFITFSLSCFSNHIICPAPWAGKMTRNLRRDWLPERARWTPCRVRQEKCLRNPYNKSCIDQDCLVKMAGYWPRFFCEFVDLDSVHSVHIETCKKQIDQYPAILTSHLVNIYFISVNASTVINCIGFFFL